MQNTRFKSLYNRFKRKFLSNLLFARSVLLVLILLLVLPVLLIGYRITYPLLPYLIRQNLASSNNRVNILLMGIRGEGNDGPNMTDSMFFVSIKKESGKITLISLPRDLWSGVINSKINSAYQLGIDKQGTQGGLILAKTAVTEIVGSPVNYAVVVDFSSFTKFIDLLGGVDIEIIQTFDDYKYPIPGKERDLCDGDPQTLCRYEHLHFDKGLQHMNGQTVLKYVRSRQSTDLSEGTDFARSRRQEQLISAIKNKLYSLHPRTYLEIYNLARSTIITDIRVQNYIPLVKILYKSRKLSIENYSLNQDNLLENPPTSSKYDYQWVLIPKVNNSKLIPEFFQKYLP